MPCQLELVEAPDLTRVPDGELGALGIGGSPGVDARGDQHDDEGLEQPGEVRVRPESESCPWSSPLAATNQAAARGAGGERAARAAATCLA